MTNTIIAFLEVFIVTPRKEFAQYPLGASFHSSAGPNRRVSGTPLSCVDFTSRPRCDHGVARATGGARGAHRRCIKEIPEVLGGNKNMTPSSPIAPEHRNTLVSSRRTTA